MNADFTPAEDNVILEIALHTSENVRKLEFWNKVNVPNRDGYSLLRRYLLLNTPIKKK
jgi:hypothetical protein